MTESTKQASAPLIFQTRKFMVLAFAATGLFALQVALIIWGCKRGFCITDEAFYLLVSQEPQRYGCLVTKFGFLLKQLPALSASALIDMRLWQLILEIAGTSVLVLGFLKRVKQSRTLCAGQELIFWSLAASASLLIFSIFPLSASYNTLSGAFSFASAGLLMGALSAKEKAKTPLTLLSGAFACLAMLAKVSSGLMLIVALLASLCTQYRGRALLIASVCLAGGAVLALCWYFSFVEPFHTSISSFMEAYYFYKDTGIYTPELVFNKYIMSIAGLAGHAIFFTVLICLSSAGSIALLNRAAKRAKIEDLSPLSVGICTLTVFYVANYLSTSESSVEAFYVLPLLLALLLLYSFRRLGLQLNSTILVSNAPLILLITLPFICSLGTNNDVIRHTKIFIAPLVITGLYLAFLLGELRKTPMPLLVTTTIYLFIINSQFATGFLKTPYGMPVNLAQQKESSSLPKLRGIKLAHGVNAFFDNYLALLSKNGFVKGDVIIAAYNMPGLVYAVDGRSVKFATFLPAMEGKGMLESALRQVRIDSPKQFFVITNYEDDANLAKTFSLAGFNFPDEFSRLGAISCPYDAPYVDIRTGKVEDNNLHNKVAVFKYSRKAGAGD